MVHVEVHETRFGAKNQRARNEFIIWMTLAIGETASSWNAPEKRDVRSGRCSQQLHQRNDCADHYAAKQAGTENTENGRHCYHEFSTIHAPELFQRCELEQTCNGDEHHGC